MERAQLLLMGRLLLAARNEQQLSRSDVAGRVYVDPATVARWERGETMPHPDNAWRLCDLFSKTPQELGLVEMSEKVCFADTPSTPGSETAIVLPSTAMSFSSFLEQDFTLRLERLVGNWSSRNARYQNLQRAILMEIEDNFTMKHDDSLNRREALYRLALLPLNIGGLSALTATFKKSSEEILAQCSAGIIACWYLRRGKDLRFAFDVVSSYLPTLKAIVQTAPTGQRKAAADLVAQCFLLQTVLSWNVSTPLDGIGYAQQAAIYSQEAENPLLEVAALRAEAAAQCYADQWGKALQVGLQAKHVLDTTPKELIPPVAQSYLYAGLATYQAYHGKKQDALSSLKKAHTTFFAQPDNEAVPLWIDHTVGNLLLNDGLTHAHLDLYQEAGDSFEQVQTKYQDDPAIPFGCRVEIWIEQAMNEAGRDDQPRDMELCIDLWTKGIEGANTMKSNKHVNDALIAYKIMRTAWLGEKRIKDLRAYIVEV